MRSGKPVCLAELCIHRHVFHKYECESWRCYYSKGGKDFRIINLHDMMVNI